MSDQYQFTNEPLGWAEWLQHQELQPFCSSELGNTPPAAPMSTAPEPSHNVATINGSAMPDGQPRADSAQPVLTLNTVTLEADFPSIVDNANKTSPAVNTISAEATPRLIYINTTCASCNAPLDNSEVVLNIEDPNVYCSRTRSAEHLAVSCGTCGRQFQSLKELKEHVIGYTPSHFSFRCAIPACSADIVPQQMNHHFADHHPHIKYRCAQCSTPFYNQAKLDQHGESTMHAAYVCRYPDCGSESTRIGDLHRHQLIHKNLVPRHPCPHCRKYRGDNGFKRKDHLRQHIRNYHHIDDNTQNPAANDSAGHSCPFEGCDKTGFNAFETEKLLKVHLKKEHPSPFQCSYPGCERVGTKGWMRERDMVKHVKKVHDV